VSRTRALDVAIYDGIKASVTHVGVRGTRRAVPSFAKAKAAGRRISTAHVESVMNHLINHRMSKKQQMRWSPAGAHHLLQVRAELLNGTLVGSISRMARAISTAVNVLAPLSRAPGTPTCVTPPFIVSLESSGEHRGPPPSQNRTWSVTPSGSQSESSTAELSRGNERSARVARGGRRPDGIAPMSRCDVDCAG